MHTRTFIRAAGATSLAIALPLLAADRLAIKTGLWENSVTTQLSGIELPAEIAQMPAAQRAQMEQMLRQMGIGEARTVTDKSCITEKDLEENTFRKQMEQASQDCDYQQVANTSKRQEWTFQCKIEGHTATGRMEVDVVNDSTVRGKMEMRSAQGNMDISFAGRWLATSCAGADTN